MTDKTNDLEITPLSEDPVTLSEKTTTVNFDKPDDLVGQILEGRFQIEKNLTDSGADVGGIGLVYLAWDMKLMGKKVVVKILREDALKDEGIVRKFLHEKEALIRLDHPGIVRILDSGTLTDGNPFMVMEYIEGYSLRKALLTKGPMSFDAAAHVIESITDALAAAHSKKILHRDIKPANIMLTPQENDFDRVRLIDFGIARVEESKLAPMTTVGCPMGTPYYVAPEQLAGHLNLTPAADIYSTAVVAYEILTGEIPFKPKSIAEVLLLQKEGVQKLPGKLRPDLPPEAEKILLSALEFEREKRPQDVRTFGNDLERALKKNVSNEILPPPPIKTKKAFLIGMVAFLILAALTTAAGIAVWNNTYSGTASNKVNSNTTDPTNAAANTSSANNVQASTPEKSGPARELTYSLSVQKMRNGQPFEDPFKSSGQEIFENGYKFKMLFQTDADGYMYVFNENNDAAGNTVYNILYPTPKSANGSAIVSAGQQIETGNNTFNGNRGTEIVWLIWTKEKQDVLEDLRRLAFSAQGVIKDKIKATELDVFLNSYKNEKTEARKDSATQQTVVTGRGDVLVRRIELEHR